MMAKTRRTRRVPPIDPDVAQRRARALAALHNMRAVSVANGSDRMTLADINRLIAKARRDANR